MPNQTALDTADRRDLQLHLEALAARSNDQTPVKHVTIAPFRPLGSYFCATVSLTYVDGRCHRMFFKDLSRPFRPKDDLAGRRDRELHVYKELLADSGLGAAKLFDIHRDHTKGRCWLLLELLDGTTISSANDEVGVKAAAWLAQMQSYFLPHTAALASDEYLIQHNRAFFSAPLARARHEVGRISHSAASTLAKLLDNYDEVTELLTAQPRTLVHGGYIPWHVIVDTSTRPVRVSAIDWELAAAGSRLYDLAYFTDEADAGAQDRMYAAYRSAAIRIGVPVPDDAEMRRIMDGFRLHRTIDWLSHSVERKFSEKKVVKLVKRATHLMEVARA